MFSLYFGILVVYLAGLSSSVEYVEKHDDTPKFDGVVIVPVNRPKECLKTTKKGDLLRVNFNGTLLDGKGFSTRYMDEPFEFVLGEGQMIAGWEAGLQDMCEGELRVLDIPPNYAWGDYAIGSGIPSRVILRFFVKLISFHPIGGAPRKINAFNAIDANRDTYLSRDEVQHYLQSAGVYELDGENGLRQMLREIFQEEDRDKNGFIEHHEFSGIKHFEL